MLRNGNNIIRLAVLTVLCGALLLSATACGTFDEMLEIFEGGNESRVDINHSGEVSEDISKEEEVPDTAAELFVTTAFGDGLMITGYTGTESFVKIPSFIDGKAVVAIAADAIKDTKPDEGEALHITHIIVPDTVVQIAASAFSGCKKLVSLTVPFVGGKADGHSYIGYVFGAQSANGNKKALPETLVEINAGGNVLADDAFKSCDGVETIRLSGITSVGKNAFNGCVSLKTLHIPDSVTLIGDGAFLGCSSLAELSLPFLGNGGDKLFFGAVFGAEDYKQNHSYVPGSLRRVTLSCPADIPAGAFYECNGLTALTLKGAVNSVGENAFYRCKKLKKLDIVADETYTGISTLSGYSFGYCSSLGEIKLADSITLIPEGAFYGCSALRSVYFGETVNAMPSTVSAVEKGAFAYCESLTAMKLSDALTVIEEQTFYGCSYLRSVDIPSTITEIKKDAFKGCNNLKDVTLGSGLTTVGDGAFSYCSSLVSITLPQNLNNYGNYAFAYCEYLSDVKLMCNEANLGKGVFAGCGRIVVTVDPESQTYQSLIESGLGNTNLKAPQ